MIELFLAFMFGMIRGAIFAGCAIAVVVIVGLLIEKIRECIDE